MAVVDVAQWALVDKISTGKTPHPGSGATWEANGKTYAAPVHAGEGKITVWDLANDEIVAEIPTSGPGLFIRAHHESPYVWADSVFGTPANRIYVFDKGTFELVKVIEECTQTVHPEFTNDGRYVYVADWQGNVVRVYDARKAEGGRRKEEASSSLIPHPSSLEISEPNLADLLPLVALGTVADVVPLDQNNRILVQQGLARIRAGRMQPSARLMLGDFEGSGLPEMLVYDPATGRWIRTNPLDPNGRPTGIGQWQPGLTLVGKH